MRRFLVLGVMFGILTSPGLFLSPDAFAAAPAQVGTVSITPNKTSITLSWSAPASQGADITDYIVKFRDVTGEICIEDAKLLYNCAKKYKGGVYVRWRHAYV